MANLLFLAFALSLSLFFIAIAWKGRKPAPKTKQYIEEVRDAAYAVIIASIAEEPEKWSPRVREDLALWLVNLEKQMAIWLGRGAEGLYIMTGITPSMPWPNGTKVIPPLYIRNELFRLGMQKARVRMEQLEVHRLQKLVATFRRLEGSNDEEAA